MRTSIIIRTLNEGRYIESLLEGISAQQTSGLGHEIILVDSGSTDGTLEIANRHGCQIHHIDRSEFSFGRSLNIGCEAAVGEILVIISGHCLPTDQFWLQHICNPILSGQAEYVYGRQIGGKDTYFSERRIFAKQYPEQSRVPQDGFFCNNANAALLRRSWKQHRFDEDLTGLEDMELAQRLIRAGGRVAYVAEASVFHHHSERWAQVRRRFEREAIALQKIMPQLHLNMFDAIRYILYSVWIDWRHAIKEIGVSASLGDIFCYRWNQYIGSWKGNRHHRKLSHAEKEKYFFPR